MRNCSLKTISCLSSVVCCLLSAVCYLPSATHARRPAELGEITVEAEVEKESKDAPSSFATIIRPEEKNVRFDTVSELIGSTVGATSKSLGGLGQFSTVSIRGSSPEQVSVYLDGVKLNTASGGAFDFSTVPADSIDRIEVIRGGGTAEFGSEAIGGVINIVTKKAKKGRVIEAFGGGGSFATIKLGSSYNEQFKKNALTLSWTHLQSAGDFTFKPNEISLSGTPSVGGGKTYKRLHNAFVSEAFLARWEHRFSDRFKLDILNDFFFTDRDIPGTEEETTILYPTNALDAREKIFRNTNSIVFGVNPFFRKEVSFTAGVTNNLKVDIFKAPTPAIGNPIDVTTYDYSLGSYLSWLAILDHGLVNQSITLRYDFRYDYQTDSTPLKNAILTGRHTRLTNSVFVRDEIAFLKDRVFILPAARYEKASDFSENVSFKGGLKILPVNYLTIKSNIEKSFRYPSFYELYFPDQGYIRGNPNLKKEEAWNLDAGFSIETKYASIEAAYFKNWIDNSIIFVPISAFTIEPVNTFKVNSSGAEVSLTLDPVRYVHAGFNYTFLSAHYASNSNQLPGRPKHEINARLELSYDFTERIGGTLFGVLNYKSELPLNPQNTVFLRSRSTVDLGINLRFARYYYFTFEAKDITNVQTYDARGFPLPRRSFFATLGAKWS